MNDRDYEPLMFLRYPTRFSIIKGTGQDKEPVITCLVLFFIGADWALFWGRDYFSLRFL